MSKLTELKTVNGVRNDVPTDRFASGDLDAGVNIDIDETGKSYRRLGTTQVTAGNMHSLWSSESTGSFVVNNGILCRLSATGLTSLQPVRGFKLAYVALNNAAFWTDGVESGVATAGTVRQWGIPVPPQVDISRGAGDMLEGTYMCAITYVRDDGIESGATASTSIYVLANSSVTVYNIRPCAAANVQAIRVYMTSPNGETPQLVAEIANGTTTITITALPVLGPQLRTQFFGPAPAGQVVGYYNGRAYIAAGNVLYYSQPYEYELFDLAYGYMLFEAPIQTLAAVNNGIFVGTTEATYSVYGAGPEDFKRAVVSPFGTVRGTEYYVRNDILLEDGDVQGMSPVWMSTKGLVLGGDGSKITALTSGRYQLPPATVGASLMKIRSATPQFVTSIFN